MGCCASRSGRVGVDDDDFGAYSTEMLERYNQKHSVYALQHRDRELAQEIIALRRHTATERQRLVVRISKVQDLAVAATSQLRDEVRMQLGEFSGQAFAELRWEVAASASHVSHLGARLQNCREQRQVDQQQTANAIAHLRRDFTAQVSKLTERVQAAERFALAAEAAQRRAESDAEARAVDAAERARDVEDQRAEFAAHCSALAEQVERVVSEKLRVVELFGMAEARAAAAEAAQRRAEDELAKAVAQTSEATATRKAAMRELHERVVDSNLSKGRTPEGARAAASEVLANTRLEARLEVAQKLRMRAEDEARQEKTLRQKAEATAVQWAYRVAALEGREVVRELGVELPDVGMQDAEIKSLQDTAAGGQHGPLEVDARVENQQVLAPLILQNDQK